MNKNSVTGNAIKHFPTFYPCFTLTLLLLSWVHLPFYAQSAAPPGAGKIQYPEFPLEFEHLTSEQGLSTNVISCIVQDRRGFMWFGTSDGLNKYDGYRFTVYKHNPSDSTSIAGNYITTILESQNGTLWIGTNAGGLSRMNPKERARDRFTNFRHDPGDASSLGDNTIWKIYEDKAGTIWLGTASGLSRIDGELFRTWEIAGENSPASGDIGVSDICEDGQGDLWLATRAGLYRFDPRMESFEQIDIKPGQAGDPGKNLVLIVEADRHGAIWIGTLNELARYDPYSGGLQTYPALRKVMSLNISHPEGRMWIGTSDHGLYQAEFDRQGITKLIHHSNDTARPGGLSRHIIHALYQDRSGILWVGTLAGGVHKLNPNKNHFKTLRRNPDRPVKSLNDDVVTAIYEDRSGIFWIGAWKGGLNRLDPATGNFTHYSHDPDNAFSVGANYIKALLEDRPGRLWAGVWDADGGLGYFDREQEKFYHIRRDSKNPESLSDNLVRCLVEDRRGTLWVGTTNGGLNRLKIPLRDVATERLQKDPAFYNRFDRFQHDPANPRSLSDNNITALLEDSEGTLWIGTWSGGLCRLDEKNQESGQFIRYQNNPGDPGSLPDNRVWSLHQDRENRIWVGTAGGLSRLLRPGDANPQNRRTADKEYFVHYTEEDGLANNNVLGILESGRGNLWLSHGSGIARFDPRGRVFINYNVADGLPSADMNANVCFRSRGGEMFFGSVAGAIYFHPDSILANANIPPVVITSFKLFEKTVYPRPGGDSPLKKHISEAREVTLSHTDNFISFEYAALDYQQPHKNQYAYKLEGLHKDWVYCGNRRYASFNSLPPGEYAFRVKGSNNDGVWNEEGAAVRIVITPPWWRTWWAYLLYAAAAVGLAWAGRWVAVHWKSLISIRARKISHYKLLELLGKGGMGEVFKAIDLNSREIVALKLLHPEMTNDPENRKRLSHEGRLLASFSHPHIVNVFEVGENRDHCFIAMEYLAGGTLRDYLRNKFPLPLAETKRILLQIAEGLQEIHARGIIHRDLKTGNIMLDGEGRLRIMDFGLSKSPLVSAMTSLGTVLGTLGYVAPEQVTGMNVDHRVDIFSFGVMIYELLTNQLPFRGENEMVLIHAIFNVEPPPPSQLRPGEIDRRWDEIVARCLAKNPRERFQSIEEVMSALAD